MSIVSTPADGIALVTVDPVQLAAIEAEVLDERGRQRPVWAGTYAKYDLATRAALCVKNALYGLVTHELVGFIREHIGARFAIEVGSGDGVLADELTIQGTDNFQQQDPDIAREYARMLQPTITYGPRVERIDAEAAVAKYAPQVIVASWLTHKWKQEEDILGGSLYAADELVLLANCEMLIFIGNTSAHQRHRLLGKPHLHFQNDWMYSRAVRGRNFVGVWKGGKA